MQKVKKALLFFTIALLFAGTILGGCSTPSENTGKVEENSVEVEDIQKPENDVESTGAKTVDAGEEELENPLTLIYFGHSTFLIQYDDASVLVDPYQPDFGNYGKIDLQVDAVLISHEHTDHNYSPGGGPGATVLRGLTADGDWHQVNHCLAELQITSVAGTFHGRNLGKNGVFILTTPDLRLAYLGDIGHTLQEKEAAQIGKPDVLFLPVGGYYTIPPREALELIAQLSPGIVIPMHYKTADNQDTPIGTLEEFLELEIPYPVKSQNSNLELTSKTVPAPTEIWTMEYALP